MLDGLCRACIHARAALDAVIHTVGFCLAVHEVINIGRTDVHAFPRSYAFFLVHFDRKTGFACIFLNCHEFFLLKRLV